MRSLSMLMVAGLLSACGGSSEIWLFTVGEPEDGDGAVTCEENFTLTDCPSESEPEPSPWTYENSRTVSDGAFFGEVMDGPSGQKVLVIDDMVYIGAKSGGDWVFSWTNEVSSSSSSTHETGYNYTETNTSKQVTTITLDMSGSSAEGTYSSSTETFFEGTESDTWDALEVFSFGQLVNNAPIGLEGQRENSAEEQDCDNGPCKVTVTRKTSFGSSLNGLRVSSENGYEGLSNVGQDPGWED